MKTNGQSLIGYPTDSTYQTGRVLQTLIAMYFSVAGLCPRVARPPVAFLVGLVHYLVAGRQRLIVAESLSKALGSTQDSTQIKKHTRKVFVYFYNYLIDLAHQWRKAPSRKVNHYRVNVHGSDNLDKALESGRPLVFAGLHFGNWDLGLEMLASIFSDRPMISVVSPMRHMMLRGRIDNGSSQNYREVVGARRGLAIALRALKEGGVVMTMLDGPGDDVTRLPTRFLQGTALLSTLPLRLAKKSNALIIPTALAYVRGSQFNAFVGVPLESPQATDDEALDGGMQALVAQIEPWVKQYPAQWYCFHRLWQQDSASPDNRKEYSAGIAAGTGALS